MSSDSQQALLRLRNARHAFDRALPPPPRLTLVSLIASYDRGQARGLLERVGQDRLCEVLEKVVGEDEYVAKVLLGALERIGEGRGEEEEGKGKGKENVASVNEGGKGRAGMPAMERKMSKD